MLKCGGQEPMFTETIIVRLVRGQPYILRTMLGEPDLT